MNHDLTDTDTDIPHHSFEPSENAMQAAGRLHNYTDIRSARRSYRRTRKYPRKRPRDSGYCRCCFDIRYNEVRLARKKELHNALRHEDWDDSTPAEGRWVEEADAPSFEHSSSDRLEVASDTELVDTTEDDWEVLLDASSDGLCVV